MDAGLWLNRPGEGSLPHPAVRELLVWTESDDGITGSEGTQNRKAGAIGRGSGACRQGAEALSPGV